MSKDKYNEVLEFATNHTENWFSGGKGLKDTRHYTSGNHGHLGFENFTEKILWKAVEVYGLTDRVKINQDYIEDPTGRFDSQRMDHHVYIDDKIVLVEENRAWTDKPFYMMKRAVVKLWMELPHVKSVLHDDVKFILSLLAKDYKDILVDTCDKVLGHGERMVDVNFSGRPRRKGIGYFDNGCDIEEVKKYVNIICQLFEKFDTTNKVEKEILIEETELV